nr:MAG TPA: hypothetical protein [Bacteriophage sp.]
MCIALFIFIITKILKYISFILLYFNRLSTREFLIS